jgi:hypothetical protein
LFVLAVVRTVDAEVDPEPRVDPGPTAVHRATQSVAPTRGPSTPAASATTTRP